MASSELSPASVRDRIISLKKELADLTIAQKKVEAERQGLEAQRDSLINQFTDYSARIASLEEACNMYAIELKNLEREKKIEESALQGYLKQKAVLDVEVERIKKIVVGAQHRRQTLEQEHTNTTAKANLAREEMSKSQEEIAGIINILQVLTENITFTIEQIKGEIQHGNQEALEEASQEFHGYVSDVTQMLSTIESVGLGDLGSFIQNIKMFIENADESVNHIMARIQENADNAVHSSTEQFDGFMRDLIEIINNTRIILKKLQIADLGNIYDAVNAIRANLDSQINTLLENQSLLATKETQLDFLNKEIARHKKMLEDLEAKIKNLHEKNKLKTNLIETTKKNMENVKNQKAQIDDTLAKLKADMTARWDRIRVIIDEVGRAQDNLFDIKVAKITPKMVPLAEVGATSNELSNIIPQNSKDKSFEPPTSQPIRLKAGTSVLKLVKDPHPEKIPTTQTGVLSKHVPHKPSPKPALELGGNGALDSPKMPKVVKGVMINTASVKPASKKPTVTSTSKPAGIISESKQEDMVAPVKTSKVVVKKAVKKPIKKS